MNMEEIVDKYLGRKLMILNEKFMEVLTIGPDSAFAIVTMGKTEPHVVNSWNSYVTVEGDTLLIPAGRMLETEHNIERDNNIQLTICNREVTGKSYTGTGFLVRGKASFEKEGERFERIRDKFFWARAVLVVNVESIEQTL